MSGKAGSGAAAPPVRSDAGDGERAVRRDDATLGDFVAGDGPLPEESVELELRSQALRLRVRRLPTTALSRLFVPIHDPRVRSASSI